MRKKSASSTRQRRSTRSRVRSTARVEDLDELIAEATVDAHDEEEQSIGFFSLLEERLALPFETRILGVDATAERLEPSAGGGIGVVCKRGAHSQVISLLDLPLPEPPPRGVECIEAYRRWARR
jgi:hypothetical protein